MNFSERPKAKKVKSEASEMLNASLAAGKDVPLNGEALRLLVPSQPVKVTLPQPASGSYELTAEENARFLHLVTACAQIRTHYELFLLAQGQLQFFLPQDILIAAWGDFRAQDPQLDVISGLPGVRTNRVCNGIARLAKGLHKIWIDGGSQAMMPNKTVAELRACDDDACAPPCAVSDMSLTLVHGTSNKRDGYDSLYIALRRPPFARNGTEVRLRFLADAVIHQLDVAYSKVAALGAAHAPSNERSPAILLSVREEEITHWVCQGKTNGQIAQILGISVNTVKNHVHRIFDKLGANNRTEAVVKYRTVAGSAGLNFASRNQ